MGQKVKTIAIVAGEASGDLLGSLLMAELRQAVPQIRFIGVGGPKMRAVGMETLFPMEKLAVNGYVEVLWHLRELLSIRRALRNYFLANPPDLFVGIDAPDFNLALERSLKQHGIPTVHYVSPSIWAWRGERIHRIRRAVSQMLVLFPFELALYQEAGIPATYIGHPLADQLPEYPNRTEVRERMRILPRHARVFALLPGSRCNEVKRLAGTYIDTARLILQKFPEAQFLVPLASRETRTIFENEIWRQEAQQLPITLLFGHAHDALAAADAALIASGTATLEAALLKCPMVITYKLSPLTYWIARRKQYLPYVGLPNILAGRFVVPEILQDDATPENLAQALLNLVGTPRAVNAMTGIFQAIHHSLRQDAAQKATAAILPYLA